MLKASKTFSKAVFWSENVFYIVYFSLTQLALVPYLYFKIALDILKTGSILTMLWLMPAWVLFGVFYLIYISIVDVKYLIKSMNLNFEVDKSQKEKEEEDLMQDKIILYNEVIDVMRAI